jgi:hypothetical protein
MWPFKHRPLLDDDVARWHVDNACWLLRNLARTPVTRESRLILPGAGCYRFGKATGHDLAMRIFDQTKAFAGMADWPLTLRADEDSDERHIGYDPSLANDPFRLIAMLARDLSHRLLYSLGETPHCSDENEWLALTDVLGCLMGFGVFLANDAITVVTVRQGSKYFIGEYRTDFCGHLSEHELVFDLAMFLTVRNLSASEAQCFLEPHLVDHLKTALKDIDAYKDELKQAYDGY